MRLRLISLSIFIASLANASESEFVQYNFIGIKSGVVQQVPLYGNTGLETSDNTYIVGGSIGRRFHEILSVDLEYVRRAKNTSQDSSPGETDNSTTWSMQSDTVMLNLAVNLMTESKITPYLRGGAGISFNSSDTYTLYDQELQNTSYFPGKNVKNFAWQLGGGASFYSNSIFNSEIEYMFVNRGSVETQNYYLDQDGDINAFRPIKANFYDHVLTIGFKFKL